MKVVVRRFRGPVVPIQLRDEWKCSARDPLDDEPPLGDALPEPTDGEDADDADEEEGEDEDDDVGEVREERAPDAPATAVLTGAGAEVDDVTVDSGCGAVGVGTVEVDTVGSGTGDDGTVTVTVGTGGSDGGGGSEIAAAVPASSAAPETTVIHTRTRIPE